MALVDFGGQYAGVGQHRVVDVAHANEVGGKRQLDLAQSLDRGVVVGDLALGKRPGLVVAPACFPAGTDVLVFPHAELALELLAGVGGCGSEARLEAFPYVKLVRVEAHWRVAGLQAVGLGLDDVDLGHAHGVPVGLFHELLPRHTRLHALDDKVVVKVHAGLDAHGLARHHGLDLWPVLGAVGGEVEHQALGVLAPAARSPGHLYVLVRPQHSQHALVVDLAIGRKDDRLGGHVDSDRKGLGRKEHLDQALAKEDLDNLLQEGQHAAVVKRHALDEQFHERVVLGDSLHVLVAVEVEADDALDLGRFFRGQEAVLDLVGVLLALPPRKYKEQPGQEGLLAEGVDAVIHAVDKALGPDGALDGRILAAPGPNGVGVPPLLVLVVLLSADKVGVDFPMKQIVLIHDDLLGKVSVKDAVTEGDDTVLGRDEVDGALLEFAHPARKQLGAVDGRREHDEVDFGRQEHDALLPDLAPLGIVDVVHFVKDHGVDIVEREQRRRAHAFRGRAPLKQQVPQDLGGHDDDVGVRAELDVARHDADAAVSVELLQVVELLVGQGLDGRGIKHSAARTAFGERVLDLILADEGLAASGLCSHQDVFVLLNRIDGLFLKGVQRVRMIGLDVGHGSGDSQHSCFFRLF